MMISAVTPWWETLAIRQEILLASGSIDDVQMSLFQAVQGVRSDGPRYADAAYYGQITHPSPQFIDLMKNVSVRLGGNRGRAYAAAPALWRLDQAMGGGKSHGLIGLYHLAAHPAALRETDIGKATFEAAKSALGGTLAADLGDPQVVVLACDNMTAGRGVATLDGPAVSLYERFLWRLFGGDMALYKRYQPHHADKSKIVEALAAVGRPILILVDEIMDYIRQLSDSALADLAVKDMAFLRALLDSVNDVPNVAMVVVMIASEKDSMDLDEMGASRRAELDQLLVRNGKPATINDTTDFAAILRRRLFESNPPVEVLDATARLFAQGMIGPWKTKVFDALNGRWIGEWDEEVARCYPFHPQLIALAEQEWAKLAGFQRVRSTIRIFAATVYALARRGKAGQWAPLLIGPGDLPLSVPAVREAVIGSGLISDNRAQANYRQIASTDIVAGDDLSGTARTLDRERVGVLFLRENPRATERAATCLFLCSVVGTRGAGRQGATEPEVKSATFVPSANYGYADADGIVTELKDFEGGGLASLEIIPGKGGQAQRLLMSTRQTLNMLLRTARGTITDEERDAELAAVAERVVTTGPFKQKLFVSADLGRSTREVLEAAGIDDARATRLVVLDPRQFSLLNGIDKETRSAIRAAMGIGPDKLPVQWASSAVYAVVNTQRRAVARGTAVAYLAWDRVADMADVKLDAELHDKAAAEKAEARRNLETAVKRAYQHVLYLGLGDGDEPRVEHTYTFEHENQSALNGTAVWKALVEEGKAFDVETFNGKALLHNIGDNDYLRPLDEVRDAFWNAPRMPLLPGAESDLQRAIYEAVSAGKLRLVGADGGERAVTRASEIGVGQASLRLARPLPVSPVANDGATGGGEGIGSQPTGGNGTNTNGEDPGTPHPQPETEQEIAFSLMTSLGDATKSQSLYHLLIALADRVDEGAATYGEFMVKVRVNSASSEALAHLARAAGAVPSVRDV